MPVPKQNVPSRGWGEDFWAQVTEREGELFKAVVDNPLYEARLHGLHQGGEIVFLRRIVPGGADRSYGVYVARLAGLPGAVINRAWDVLRELEDGAAAAPGSVRPGGREPNPARPQQLPLIDTTPAAIESLLGLDIASMTPLEAINKLYKLQDEASNAEN